MSPRFSRETSPSGTERTILVNSVSNVYELLRDTSPPFCAGTCPVPVDMCTVFYRSTDGLKEINLANATREELEHFTRACKPASFGRENQDVYDESYRKAGKMDAGDYITRFSVDGTDIISTIKSKLVQFGNKHNREIEAQPYKLNVYGKGSFFKVHKDTPRSNRMFGSLVVVFPTAHEGGIFTLSHHDHEWNTDFSAMLSCAQESPSVGFVAFYSDIDHEVSEVTSGHRVTLTYNLLFTPSTPLDSTGTSSVSRPLGKTNPTLANAIEDICDLYPFQYGGYLAFGLLYQYPVGEQESVTSLRTCLKGQDAALGSILDDLDLKWDLRMLYHSQVQYSAHSYLLSEFAVQFGPYANINDLDNLLPDGEYVTVIHDSPFQSISSEKGNVFFDHGRNLVLLTPIPRFPRRPAKFISYGNDALSGKLYTEVCLIAEIPALIDGTERPPSRVTVEARRESLHDQSDEEEGEE